MADVLLTIDVEDWFQVENLRPWNPPSLWDRRELRVETNVHRLLDLFDEQSSRRPAGPAQRIRATFFVLGWIARRLPQLVREIAVRGHEVASHGMNHIRCDELSEIELREELNGSRLLLEDTIGEQVHGFRAPNFSVNDQVLRLAREFGYRYDSSYNSFSLHGRYGRIRMPEERKSGAAYELASGFYEIPPTNLNLKPTIRNLRLSVLNGGGRFVFPWSGGAYFRLLPYSIFRQGVEFLLKRSRAYVFYLHPWEIDAGQPRPTKVPASVRFRHYTNLERTESRFRRMISAFSEHSFMSCRDHLRVYSSVDLSLRLSAHSKV